MIDVLPKLARWLGFTLLLSLTPLFATWLALRAFSKPSGMSVIVGKGELLLIGAAMGAAAIGELIPVRRTFGIPRNTTGRILLMSLTLFLVLISAMYFAFISLGVAATNPAVVSSDSLALFIFITVLSGACVAVGGLGNE
jgi:hypothetical protein